MAKTREKKKVNQYTVPTKKQEKLAELAIAESKKTGARATRSELMAQAGYARSTIKANVKDAFNTVGFLEALEARGVTNDKISKVFDDAMQAKVVTIFQGEATETNTPDHKVRLSAVNSLGDFTGQRKTHVLSQQVNVNVDTSNLAELLGL